jgi:hypothetical protein
LKLRIRDNSIRLRLSKTEVDTVNSDGLVRGKVQFAGSNSFTYVLESSPATVKPEAHFSRVSISSEQNLDEKEHLKILVEKDFACLAPREGEDESDLYPHPDADDNSR